MFSQRLSVAAAMVLFLAGLIYFARFTSNSYPAYSSLRSDERGTRLLFLGLQGSGKLSVTRNYLPLSLVQARNSALLFIGVKPDTLLTWSEEGLSNLERLARMGNSVTIGITDDPVKWKELSGKKLSIAKRWSLALEPRSSPLRLRAENGWIAESDDLLYKSFGAGRILILTETDLLSNGELAGGIPPFVPFLIGNAQAVVLDETHLGVEETGSVAGLARRYHLQGLLIGLLLLAMLFVWNRVGNSAVPQPNEEPLPVKVERDVLVSLLERNIGRSHLISACVTEWSRANPSRGIRNPPAHLDAVKEYREIQDQLKPIKHTQS